ncbi:MAG: hypothetical protein WKF59_11850 [Chitinophagaceae bacterium]
MTPYTAVFIFAIGIFVSNFLFNTIIMKRPFEGSPVTYTTYFEGNFRTHLVGILGGLIWGLGNSLNFIAAGKAGSSHIVWFRAGRYSGSSILGSVYMERI